MVLSVHLQKRPSPLWVHMHIHIVLTNTLSSCRSIMLSISRQGWTIFSSHRQQTPNGKVIAIGKGYGAPLDPGKWLRMIQGTTMIVMSRRRPLVLSHRRKVVVERICRRGRGLALMMLETVDVWVGSSLSLRTLVYAYPLSSLFLTFLTYLFNALFILTSYFEFTCITRAHTLHDHCI